MRLLSLFSLLVFECLGCASPYRKLKPVAANDMQVLEPYRYQPQFSYSDKVIYRCNMKGKFLSGKNPLSGKLLFQEIPGGGRNTRIVYSGESGKTLFDFGWIIDGQGKDSFRVYDVTQELNKPAAIQALRNDLELLMVRDLQSVQVYRMQNQTFYRTKLDKGFGYYVVNDTDKSLDRIEIADKRRISTIYQFAKQNDDQFADSVSIVHEKGQLMLNAKKTSANP